MTAAMGNTAVRWKFSILPKVKKSTASHTWKAMVTIAESTAVLIWSTLNL